MLYRLTLSIVLFLLFVSGALAQSAPDTSYVRQDELEPGFGLLWINYNTGEIGQPKNIIDIAAISPKGDRLAYSENGILKVKNLTNGSITIIGSPCYDAQWSPTGDTLMFTMWSSLGFHFLDMNSGASFQLDNAPDTLLGICQDTWAPDGNLYFPTCILGRHDSTFWRVLVDSSLHENRYVYQYLNSNSQLPLFPPKSVTYYLLGTYDERLTTLEGFNIVTGFNYDGRRSISIALPDTGWSYSRTNIWSTNAFRSHIIAGSDGDAYVYLMFRAKQERSHYSNPIDSVDSAARNACGWYHIDTAGHGLTQLIRSWTPDLPLSVTADGQKVYYAFLNPDSTMAVWEMDRFGRNKRQVTTPLEGIADVREPAAERNPSPDNHIECSLSGNEVIVRWPDDDASTAEINVADARGGIVYHVTTDIDQNEIALPIDGLATGVYFVTVRTARMLRMGKFAIRP